VRVAVRREHLEAVVADSKDRDVERAAAQVVHGDLLVLLAVEAVGKRGGRGFIDDAQHFKARNAARVFRGLPLCVVEIRGHGDHRLFDLRAEVRFRGLTHLLQNHGGDFRRPAGLAHDLDLAVAGRSRGDLVGHRLLFFGHLRMAAAHESLDGIDRVLRIGHSLTLRRGADEPLAVACKCHHGRRRARAFRIRDDNRLAAFHDGYARVRGAQIDADDLTHDAPNLLRLIIVPKDVRFRFPVASLRRARRRCPAADRC